MVLKAAFTCFSCRRKSATFTSYFRVRSTPVSSRALIPDNARAVSRRVLLGTAPVLTPAPPKFLVAVHQIDSFVGSSSGSGPDDSRRAAADYYQVVLRSEERRVGKACR